MSPGRRTTVVRMAAGLSLAMVMAATGCTSRQPTPRQPPAPALSPAEAGAAVRAYAARWARASTRRDRGALGRIHAGVALAATSAEFEAERAMQLPTPATPRLRELKVAVPRRERPAFPAHFLAMVTWTSLDAYPFREVLEFEQASRGAPWLVTTRARLVDNLQLPAVAVDADGFADLVDAGDDEALRHGAEALAELLASYYDDDQPIVADRGVYDTTVAPGPFTSGLTKRRLASNEGTQIQRLRDYRPGPYRTAAYRLEDGGGLLLLALTASRQVFPKDRQVVPSIVQYGSREQLGGLVPPGVYGAVAYQMATMLAVAVPRAGSDDPLRVVAWREQDTHATPSGP
jgi:hypothetical protein